MENSNIEVWEKIYASGHMMHYPDDAFVRLFQRLIKSQLPEGAEVLDYGFGSGVTSLHMAKNGFFVEGLEISQHAVDIVLKRFKQQDLMGHFQVNTSDRLPFEQERFDALVAWQVLTYNNFETLRNTLLEMHRVLKPGGLFLATFSMPGSALDLISESLNDGIGTKEVRQGGQTGAKICIPSREELEQVFSGFKPSIGSVVYDFGVFELAQNSFWVVSFVKN